MFIIINSNHIINSSSMDIEISIQTDINSYDLVINILVQSNF